jgi:hypothetical protein
LAKEQVLELQMQMALGLPMQMPKELVLVSVLEQNPHLRLRHQMEVLEVLEVQESRSKLHTK